MTRTGGIALLAGVWSGCLDATEITVEITSDLDCAQIRTTSIFTGPKDGIEAAPRTTTTQCMPKSGGGSRIGSIVLVPSSNGDTLGIHVSTELVNGRCGAGGSRCIDAYRSLGFISHASLRMPISMDARCIDFPCKPGLTCVQGTCVDDAVDPMTCRGAGCALEGGAPDVQVPPPPCAGGIQGLNPVSVWHFDEGSGSSTTAIGIGGTVALAAGVGFAAAGTCNSGLQFASTSPGMSLLDPTAFQPTTEVAVWVRFKTTNATGLVPLVSMEGNQGFALYLDNGAPGCSVRTTAGTPGMFSVSMPLADGMWHSMELTWKSSTGAVSLFVNDAFVGGVGGISGSLQPITTRLSIGSTGLQNGMIDELYLYDKAPP